jgi:hypothetical protein
MTTAPTPSIPHAAHKPHIKLGSRPYTYSIESDDTPGRFYTTDAYHLTCSCEAGKHGKRCWHLGYALTYDTWRKAQQAKAAQAAQAAQAARLGALKDAFDALNATPLAITRPSGMAALQECFG